MTVPFLPPRAEPAPAAPVTLKCRYRYATGCTAEFTSQPGLHSHEKISPAHALHRIELRACPECGRHCENELGRAQHLSAEHGIRARSPERQEADARQVKELYDARYGSEPPPAGAPVLTVPSLNGHAPAPPDLSAARDAFGVLLSEVATLRAENTSLKAEAALLAQVRSLLG